jgi:hypothetical protein
VPTQPWLPDDVGLLVKVHKFNVACNALTSLPISLCSMGALKVLRWGCTSSRIQFTQSLNAPGFNPWTHQMRNWFQNFCSFKCILYRYTAAGRQPAGGTTRRDRKPGEAGGAGGGG